MFLSSSSSFSSLLLQRKKERNLTNVRSPHSSRRRRPYNIYTFCLYLRLHTLCELEITKRRGRRNEEETRKIWVSNSRPGNKKKKRKENRRVRDSFLHAIYYNIFPAGDRSSFVLLHLILIYPHFRLALSFFLLNRKKRLLIACNIRDSLFFFLPCVVTLLPFLKIVFRLGSNFYFIFCFSLLPAAFRRRNIFCVYLSSHCKDAMSFLKGILLLPPAVTSLVLFHCPNAILLPVRNSSSTAVVVVVSVEYI